MSAKPSTCGTCRHFLAPLDEAGKPLRGYGWAKDCAYPVGTMPIAFQVQRRKVNSKTSARLCPYHQAKAPNAEGQPMSADSTTPAQDQRQPPRYAIMRLYPWDTLRVGGLTPSLKTEVSIGFIPVFETRAQAVKWLGRDDDTICRVST